MGETQTASIHSRQISWKWKIGIPLASLLFTAVLNSVVTFVFREALFVKPVTKAIDAINLTHNFSEVGTIHEQGLKEQALRDRFGVFCIVIALGNSLIAAIVARKAKSFRRFLGWMVLSGMFWGISLANIYKNLHRLVLPGGLQDPRYLPVLVGSLLVISLLDCLFVAGIVRKIARVELSP